MNEINENEKCLTPPEAKGLAGILGNPEGFVREICSGSEFGAKAGLLLVLALGGTAVFGLAVGSFVNWQIALIDAVKAGVIPMFSYLLCLPTLYVFASISGCRVGFVRLALIGFVTLAVIGCILAALAPVLWLFAVSTSFRPLFILISFGLILVAVVLGGRSLLGAVKARVVGNGSGLSAWFLVFLVVALQTITLLRPLLPSGNGPTLIDNTSKCFFLMHFANAMQDNEAR